MPDDPGTTPAPRPRRRRTDIDPTFKPPKVANERRRTKRVVPDPTDATTEAATEATTGPTSPVEPTPADARLAAPWSALPMLEDRSPNPSICPFLRAVDGDEVKPPVEAPDPANRCAALREAVPQSLRQQELVCLASGHVNCPRYLRGAAVTEKPKPIVRARPSISPAILVSIVLLIGAFAASAVFALSRGSLELAAAPTRSPGASSTAAAVATPGGSATAVPASSAPASAVATASPEPTATPTPTPTPEPTPSPSPTPEPTEKPSPTSDRYEVLTACGDADDCWIYVVRRGDNLFSIANWFGVPLARVYAMNPWLESSGLRAGQELRLPPPTR